MSKSQTLRVLVNARLTAAAEEIFALFERTIAEYEEELCRSEQENQRKQRLLEEANPRVPLPRTGAGVQSPSQSPGPGLNQKITETPQIKEEPEEKSVKQEQEQLPVVCVKKEESSLLQTQEEDISSEPHFCSETKGHTELSFGTDNDDNWEPPFSCSGAQMETGTDEDHYNQVQIRDRGSTAQNLRLSPEYKSAPGTSAAVNNRNISGTDGAEKKKHQCFVCKKRFRNNLSLQIHIRVHTGERPYSCPICNKKISQKGNLKIHMRTHTNEKPYSCPFCEKTFARKDSLDIHRRIHTGERPYSCSLCNKEFNQSSNLRKHMKTHTKRS